MDCSMPGFSAHHKLPELAQTHVHRASDAIQPSHPLSSPFPPDFNLSQHYFPRSQFFTSGGPGIGVSASASVLPINIQGWFPLGLSGLIFLQFKGLSRVFSQFKSINSSVLSLLYGGTITVPILWKRKLGTGRFLTSPMLPLFLDTPDLNTQLFVLLDLKSTTTTRKHKHFQGVSCMIRKSRMKTMITTSLANKLQY